MLNMAYSSLYYIGAVVAAVSVTVSAECYFPMEMQGEFTTQWKNAQEITYTSLSVTYNSVPSWGTCHSRHRHNIILRDTERRGPACFRCIRLVQRSSNVNQVHARNLNRCFDTPEEALADCPREAEVSSRQVEEIMLYKTRGFYGETKVTQEHCPFSGRWQFSYASHGGSEVGGRRLAGCDSPTSEAGSCPNEFVLDLKFRGCDFPDFDMSFQCLGHWTGEDGLQYLSLLDTKLPQLGEEPRPRYRCAVYQTDFSTGVTHMALSNDSTCVNQLESHAHGYETLRLERLQEVTEAPESDFDDSRKQEFPEWAQGKWGEATIRGAELTYRNSAELTTYHATALFASSSSGSVGNVYLARIATPCGQLGYACLALEHRTENILEFRIGRIESRLPEETGHCDSASLEAFPWITVGKQEVRTPCPLSGTYTGFIPDAEGLCARSSTSCARPDQMEYQVYNCENTTEVYEDRVYQCYGQFEDNGLVYTYTRRLDLPIQECFVGTTLHSVQHYVMEAGAHCQRGKEPRVNGMVMTKELDSVCEEEENELDIVVVEEEPANGDEERVVVVVEEVESARPVSPRMMMPEPAVASSPVPSSRPVENNSRQNLHHHHNHRNHHTARSGGAGASSSAPTTPPHLNVLHSASQSLTSLNSLLLTSLILVLLRF